ncbi:MAG: hypothetical protein A3I07_02295 [Candidatus Doudnabacteria bacterium RIFCSPLOWO2_02_FULL_42_9]|uniref:Peptidase M50 domain-containing protein n=1 Tax=Candidatus Doudnabacteria bacterium RIFCSPHIGHO2_01_FULL_41_86 TaxID=1817821 RepID=A0A1F5N801_9BACT|nr:MAG: hypothetical protein A2717_04160 [Candidatus Doudnabacteria bacterium RIFCSPHIGHO2_01_FULL_41_86]OGE75300.1 MAG: hypothetical protein A3K07_00695 [Candidatus Doudnabacteria bacterium RIFCSPHIGHO2_01_43_10]OGE85826.1 MAG: hypothetical protein A3E28_03505 [Candidatus Doudnabacteria bacterium RIFCSPHIGHO2_12_FULL_42_22]OGE87320.1 MAG: hypothetical protein A3C49_01125 [Candidatus Doudnabacteria bacterium RIFCSPHIGHO2_02_FULL_42_25]OGE92158.1 MAG: hypothetical protein A2895_01000 [Candidatus
MLLQQIVYDMMGWGITIDIGVPLYISIWTLLLALFLFYEAKRYIYQQLKPLRTAVFFSEKGMIIGAIVGSVLMILSIAAHEAGHAVAASAFNFPITGAGVTGWGAYVSLPDGYAKGTPWAMIIVSFAGPITNILLALVCYVIVRLMDESLAENTIQFVAHMNYRLGVFNFAPFIVLDGGKFVLGVMRLFFSEDLAFTITMTISGVMLGWFLFFRKSEKDSRNFIERELEKA